MSSITLKLGKAPHFCTSKQKHILFHGQIRLTQINAGILIYCKSLKVLVCMLNIFFSLKILQILYLRKKLHYICCFLLALLVADSTTDTATHSLYNGDHIANLISGCVDIRKKLHH